MTTGEQGVAQLPDFHTALRFDLGGLPTLSSSGHMIGGNPEAAADSFVMTKAFLDARLKMK